MFKAYRQLLRNRNLARLLFGEFVSGIGDWLYLVAILIVIYTETGDPVLLGVMGAARILPYVILSVPAGWVVDHYDRRMVLLVTDIARGVLMLALAAIVLSHAPVIFIVAISIFAACFSTFFGPALAALLPSLVDESELGPANSAWATLDNLAFIVGPALAAVLITAGGLALAFLLNALSFAVVAVILFRLPRAAPVAASDEPKAAEQAPVSSWRELVGPLAGPFLLDSVTSLVGGGLGVLTVVIAIDVLRAGEAGTGYLNAATGVGGVLAGFAAGSLVARRLSVPLLIGGLAGGIGLVWLGFSNSLIPAMFAIGVGVAGALLLDVVNTTLIQRIVPDALRGRALGVVQMTSALFYAGGSLAYPLIATTLGVTPLLIGSGVAMAISAVGALLLSIRAGLPGTLDPERSRVLELPIFAGLPANRLEAAAQAFTARDVRAGEVVVRQGESADRFYVISSGSFAVTQVPAEGGEEIRLRELGLDDVFGEIGLLQHSPRTATVTAETDGRLLVLDGARFLELVGSGPGLSSRLLDLYRGALARG
ncbi:MAG: MFS transporter [Chloroflexota bacterium]